MSHRPVFGTIPFPSPNDVPSADVIFLEHAMWLTIRYSSVACKNLVSHSRLKNKCLSWDICLSFSTSVLSRIPSADYVRSINLSRNVKYFMNVETTVHVEKGEDSPPTIRRRRLFLGLKSLYLPGPNESTTSPVSLSSCTVAPGNGKAEYGVPSYKVVLWLYKKVEKFTLNWKFHWN